MKWLVDFLFRSSIGRKVVMSLSGLFLILFLVVHLLGNLQLFKQDQGMQFNLYTYFMTHNPLIKIISYTLYATILLHTIQGIYLALQNRKAKGKSYQKSSQAQDSFFGKYMLHLGLIIFVFIVIHMYQFWWQMKLGVLSTVQYPGHDHIYQDLYAPVIEIFQQSGYVIFYIISMMIVSFHLIHGFRSAFQSLGINHKKYNGLIHKLGWAYSILIPAAFASLPIYVYFTHA